MADRVIGVSLPCWLPLMNTSGLTNGIRWLTDWCWHCSTVAPKVFELVTPLTYCTIGCDFLLGLQSFMYWVVVFFFFLRGFHGSLGWFSQLPEEPWLENHCIVQWENNLSVLANQKKSEPSGIQHENRLGVQFLLQNIKPFFCFLYSQWWR